MVEICPGSGVCVPVQTREIVFSVAKNRRNLVTKLLRVFYSDDQLIKAGNVESLPLSEEIVGAIIGKSESVINFIQLFDNHGCTSSFKYTFLCPTGVIY